ncbi:MAG TPA: spermidine synthase [Streptosporangiales bacterium]
MTRTVLGRADGALGGEVVLRSRPDGAGGTVYELVVDGVFAMDSVDTSTERALATAALARVPGRRVDVVAGGLGLGYTVRALLDDPRVGRVEVIELEAPLVEWLRADAVPGMAGVLRDPRVHVRVGDVRTLLPTLSAASVDAVLLDVDNGPGFLVHRANAAVYEDTFLRACLARLRAGGVLAVWSSDPVPALRARLSDLAGECEELPLLVERDGHRFDYVLYLATRPSA